MAVQRPNVIVYQEYQNISVAPDVPDLNTVIVGPCYQLLDYLDDKADTYSTTYGTLNAANPVTTVPAVTIATPPNLAAGALLVDSSVRIFFDEARAILHGITTGAGADAGTFYIGDNLFWTTRSTGYNMNVGHIAAGDMLIARYGTGIDYVKTVKELAFMLYCTGGGVDFTAVSAETGDTITISADEAATPRDGVYTVKKKYIQSGSVVADSIEIEDATNLIGAAALCHIRIASPAGTVRFDSSTGSKVTIGDWCNLRTTSDFASTNSGVAAERIWRIERAVTDHELAAAQFSVASDTRVITVNTGISIDVSSVLTSKAVSYAKIYVEYKALRQDLQNVTEYSSYVALAEELGKLDARNPLLVGAYIAQANTTTPIKVYGISEDTLAGYLDFLDRVSSDRSIYAIVPLTYDTAILGALNTMCESYSDPTYVLAHGIKQKFRVVLGAVDLSTQKYVVNATGGASTLSLPGTIPGAGLRTLSITVQTNQVAPADFAAQHIIPGDLVTITYGTTPLGTFTVAHVNAPSAGTQILEVNSELGSTALPDVSLLSPTNGDTLIIHDATGLVTKTSIDVNTVSSRTFTITTAVLDALYLTLSCPTSTFVTSGVVPGDYIQVPTDPEVNSFTTYSTFTVALVESETRLRIVNDGTNQPDLETELPHGIKRTAAPTDRVVTAGSVFFRVMRNMTKDQQVLNMSAIAQSFSSKRTLLCYPNLVDITDLVDGSLARGTSTDPVAADPQPGYYLSCCVGGQTAGQAPQQGFTNLGVNGIARIYNSSEYFSESQLTTLSNSGVYVFVQDTPTSLPYSIHEVTTDVLSLETGEYMVVKDFDYVAWTFLDTLFPFLGRWNITPDALRFIRQSLSSTIATLKSQYKAKIGAPLIDATIDNVFQNTLVSADRVEAYVSVQLPMTLNIIGLHLVA